MERMVVVIPKSKVEFFMELIKNLGIKKVQKFMPGLTLENTLSGKS